MLFTPFGSGATHVMQLGPVGITQCAPTRGDRIQAVRRNVRGQHPGQEIRNGERGHSNLHQLGADRDRNCLSRHQRLTGSQRHLLLQRLSWVLRLRRRRLNSPLVNVSKILAQPPAPELKAAGSFGLRQSGGRRLSLLTSPARGKKSNDRRKGRFAQFWLPIEKMTCRRGGGRPSRLPASPRPLLGDRVQLQPVVLNVILSAVQDGERHGRSIIDAHQPVMGGGQSTPRRRLPAHPAGRPGRTHEQCSAGLPD